MTTIPYVYPLILRSPHTICNPSLRTVIPEFSHAPCLPPHSISVVSAPSSLLRNTLVFLPRSLAFCPSLPPRSLDTLSPHTQDRVELDVWLTADNQIVVVHGGRHDSGGDITDYVVSANQVRPAAPVMKLCIAIVLVVLHRVISRTICLLQCAIACHFLTSNAEACVFPVFVL